MSRGIFNNISGRSGEVRIENLGILVGEIERWEATRRRGDGPGEGLYDLFAVFSYFNPHLWDEKGYEKRITVKIGSTEYLVTQEHPSFGIQVDGRKTLRIQGVRLDVTD